MNIDFLDVKAPNTPKPRCHVFVCTNQRPDGHPRGSCHAKGSEELLQALKAEAVRTGIQKEVRIQKAGCLDVCEQGAALVVYPEGTWYGEVTPSDAKEWVETQLVRGQKIDRLLIPGRN